MPTQAFVTLEDFDGETTTTSFWVQDLGAANYASITSDINEMRVAIEGVTRGEVRQTGFTKTFLQSFAAVTDEEAQRETKFRVVYRDTTQFLDALNTIANPGYGKTFDMELGTALLTDMLVPGTGLMNLEDGPGLALKEAIEANIRSPYNHTSATTPTNLVLYIEHIGKNT